MMFRQRLPGFYEHNEADLERVEFDGTVEDLRRKAKCIQRLGGARVWFDREFVMSDFEQPGKFYVIGFRYV